jgi:hypothetical protein
MQTKLSLRRSKYAHDRPIDLGFVCRQMTEEVSGGSWNARPRLFSRVRHQSESTTQLTLAIDATNATSSLDVAKSAAGHPRTLSREKRIKYARKRP